MSDINTFVTLGSHFVILVNASTSTQEGGSKTKAEAIQGEKLQCVIGLPLKLLTFEEASGKMKFVEA